MGIVGHQRYFGFQVMYRNPQQTLPWHLNAGGPAADSPVRKFHWQVHPMRPSHLHASQLALQWMMGVEENGPTLHTTHLAKVPYGPAHPQPSFGIAPHQIHPWRLNVGGPTTFNLTRQILPGQPHKAQLALQPMTSMEVNRPSFQLAHPA
ncbi:alpha-aspartyl dipeptidase [Sesbania bispinosa]|nr:alpha-aspartyl dipeptidase [Sesbania bispinosa]